MRIPRKQKPRTEPVFNCDFKPWTKEYKIAMALHMLTYCSDFTHIKKISGLTITRMLKLGLIEYYAPFKGANWLRRKAT